MPASITTSDLESQSLLDTARQPRQLSETQELQRILQVLIGSRSWLKTAKPMFSCLLTVGGFGMVGLGLLYRVSPDFETGLIHVQEVACSPQEATYHNPQLKLIHTSCSEFTSSNGNVSSIDTGLTFNCNASLMLVFCKEFEAFYQEYTDWNIVMLIGACLFFVGVATFIIHCCTDCTDNSPNEPIQDARLALKKIIPSLADDASISDMKSAIYRYDASIRPNNCMDMPHRFFVRLRTPSIKPAVAPYESIGNYHL